MSSASRAVQLWSTLHLLKTATGRTVNIWCFNFETTSDISSWCPLLQLYAEKSMYIAKFPPKKDDGIIRWPTCCFKDRSMEGSGCQIYKISIDEVANLNDWGTWDDGLCCWGIFPSSFFFCHFFLSLDNSFQSQLSSSKDGPDHWQSIQSALYVVECFSTRLTLHPCCFSELACSVHNFNSNYAVWCDSQSQHNIPYRSRTISWLPLKLVVIKCEFYLRLKSQCWSHTTKLIDIRQPTCFSIAAEIELSSLSSATFLVKLIIYDPECRLPTLDILHWFRYNIWLPLVSVKSMIWLESSSVPGLSFEGPLFSSCSMQIQLPFQSLPTF